MNLPALLAAARTSALKRFILNQGLNFTIPFNSPHGFRVEPMKTGGIRVRIPWWHVNRNHIRGMHACALATGAELCSGLSVLEHLDPKQYRLIMASLHMDYHKQAKERPMRSVCRTVPPSRKRSLFRCGRKRACATPARWKSRTHKTCTWPRAPSYGR